MWDCTVLPGSRYEDLVLFIGRVVIKRMELCRLRRYSTVPEAWFTQSFGPAGQLLKRDFNEVYDGI